MARRKSSSSQKGKSAPQQQQQQRRDDRAPAPASVSAAQSGQPEEAPERVAPPQAEMDASPAVALPVEIPRKPKKRRAEIIETAPTVESVESLPQPRAEAVETAPTVESIETIEESSAPVVVEAARKIRRKSATPARSVPALDSRMGSSDRLLSNSDALTSRPFNAARAPGVRRRSMSSAGLQTAPAILDEPDEALSPKKAATMSQTLIRTVSGGAVAGLFIAGLYALPAFPLVQIVTILITLAGIFEYNRFLERVHKDVTYGAPTSLGMACVIWLAALHSLESVAWTMAMAMMLAHAVNLFYGRVSQYATRTALNLFACAYIALPLALMMHLFVAYDRAVAEGMKNVGEELYLYPHLAASALLFMMLLVWASDTGAYFAGRKLGGKIFGRDRKMAPRISPNKTWEGLWGGILTTALVAVLVPRYDWLPGISAIFHTPWAALLTGLAIALVAPLGDLAESAIKRDVGEKDSGHFLPGHGGVLDRIDSLLFAAPIYVAICFYLLPPGQLAFPK